MATISVLPPLASNPPPIPPTQEEVRVEESHITSSPCGSIRICRPEAESLSQENLENPEVIENIKGCAVDTAASAPTTAVEDTATRSPLKLVSSIPLHVSDHGNGGSIVRCSPLNTKDSVSSGNQPEEFCTAWSTPRRRMTESQAMSLDDFADNGLVSDTLKDSISNINAFMSAPDPKSARPRRPFRKWVQTFNRRRAERQCSNQLDVCDTGTPKELPTPITVSDSSYRRHSSSVSSFAYVAGIRDASISGFGTASIVPSSRKQATRSSKVQSRTDRSSRFSISARQSDDDTANDRQRLQAEAHIVARSIQRRRILEELIETEEGYIGDIKFLMNAYMTIFASSPSADAGLRLSMYSNLTDIVELHDQILGELHRVIPDSEYSHLSTPRHLFGSQAAPKRKSPNLNAVSEDENRPQRIQRKDVTEMSVAPDIAAKAANVFVKKIDRFYIYEEYRAKLDMVLDDLKITYRSIPNWGNHQKGLEALASCLSYARDWQDSKRALSIDDLLAKPIQRVCRYPLLLQELLKSTPVCDCPHAHSEIEVALEKLHEVTVAMNKATEDPFFKSHLEKTWILQERLTFPAQARSGASKSQIRMFGRIHLCSVLHVCWQTRDSVCGSYMICLLFHSWLCLAAAGKTGKSYEIQACIPLKKCSLEQADNGKGLQCHSAPFSWKVGFERNGQLYEVLMTASTKKEEEEWTHRLKDGCVRDGDVQYDQPIFTFLVLDIKTLGSSDSSYRKHSIRRATTVPPKVQLCQVILKNTSSEKDDAHVLERQLSLGRSHSVLKASRIPVIAPSRGDRERLESLISDVCTRDVLMASASSPRVRGERLIRPSASAMMRKINVPSLTGTFGRRTLPRAAASALDAATEAFESHEPTPKAPPSLRRHSSDHKMRLSLGHARLRHHDRDAKASEINVAIREETEKAERTKKTEKTRPSSSSSGDDGGRAYSLAGYAKGRPATHLRPRYSLFRKESSETKMAKVPRCPPATQFIDELGEGYGAEPANATPKTALSTPPMPSLPSIPPSVSSSILRAVVRGPRSSDEASSKSLASVAGGLLTSSTTYEMMAPLTRRGYHEYQEGRGSRVSRASREEQEEPETKTSRRWLKRPSLHRPSLHRTLRKISH